MTRRRGVSFWLASGCMAIFLGMGLSVPSFATHGTWQTLSPMPEAREGFCYAFSSAEVGGSEQSRFYSTAGFAGGDNADTRAYDVPTDTWINLTSAPTSRSEGIGVEHGGFIYCLGGRRIGVLSTLERYDPTTDSWATMAPMPTPRAGLAAAVQGTVIYAIGGRTGTVPGSGTALDCVEGYDISSNTWSPACGAIGALKPMPTKRMDLAAVARKGLIYVMGGATGVNPGVGGPVVATVEIYNPATKNWMNNPAKDMWKVGASMPTARANLALGTCGNKIIAIGGRSPGSSKLPTVEEYNPNNDTWRVLGPIPTGRSEHGAEFHGGLVFVAGSGLFGASLSAHEALSCSSLRGNKALDTFGLEPSDLDKKKALSPDEAAAGRSQKKNYPH